MQTALDAVEKPTKRGKKPESKKGKTEGPSSPATTPKKHKADNTDHSAPKKKKGKEDGKETEGTITY